MGRQRAIFLLHPDDWVGYYEDQKHHKGAINETAADTFQARARIGGKLITIGTFDTKLEASVAIHAVGCSHDPLKFIDSRRPEAAAARERARLEAAEQYAADCERRAANIPPEWPTPRHKLKPFERQELRRQPRERTFGHSHQRKEAKS